jgi:prepilin-type N-terminal cleavage/methylation domain-containing protein/prepilin-type processing-associated H-X9-DG protein
MSRDLVNRRRPRPGGLTLVEVLVAMTIIAVLLGLVLPAVQQSREAARRARCGANLKQAGLALVQFETTHGRFPPGAVHGPLPEAGVATATEHGAWTFVLPYLEQQGLADRYRWDLDFFDPTNQPAVSTQLGLLQCPSAVPDRVVGPRHDEGAFTAGGSAACTDYGPMARVNSLLVMLGLVAPGAAQGVLPPNVMCRVADITDGMSNTLLVAEDANRPELWRAGNRVPGGFAPGGPWASSANAVTIWGASDDGKTLLGSCAFNCSNNRQPYSAHPGGGNFLLADGSVRFVKDSVDLRVLVGLTTRAGGELIGPGDW